MIPKYVPKRNLYLLVLENRRSVTAALIHVIPSPPGSLSTPIASAQFASQLSSGVYIVTSNSDGNPLDRIGPPNYITVNLKGLASLRLLYQAHLHQLGQHAANTSLLPLPESHNWPARLETDGHDVMNWYVSHGWLKTADDGGFTSTNKLIWYCFWRRSFCVRLLKYIHRRRATREFLRRAGVTEAYTLQPMGKLLQNPLRSLKPPLMPRGPLTKIQWMELALAIIILVAVAIKLGHPLGSGLVIFVSLLGFLMYASKVHALEFTAKSMATYYCNACGHMRGDVSVWCQACGEGLCFRCGYNLFGNQSGCCPECGTQYCTQCGRSLYGRSAEEGCPDCGIARSLTNIRPGQG